MVIKWSGCTNRGFNQGRLVFAYQSVSTVRQKHMPKAIKRKHKESVSEQKAMILRIGEILCIIV